MTTPPPIFGGSEAFIQESLQELLEGRATFVIAHRLSTIRRAASSRAAMR